jgi:hypothetical protein
MHVGGICRVWLGNTAETRVQQLGDGISYLLICLSSATAYAVREVATARVMNRHSAPETSSTARAVPAANKMGMDQTFVCVSHATSCQVCCDASHATPLPIGLAFMRPTNTDRLEMESCNSVNITRPSSRSRCQGCFATLCQAVGGGMYALLLWRW